MGIGKETLSYPEKPRRPELAGGAQEQMDVPCKARQEVIRADKGCGYQEAGALPGGARLSLTVDNGTENARHEAIVIQCYFADPYASWQPGANEQVNWMVRRYFPKGTDFSKITDEQAAWVESRINNRPRKCLDYKTPAEADAVAHAP